MKKHTLLAAGALCATAAGWMPPHAAQAQQTAQAQQSAQGAGGASTQAATTPAASTATVPAKPVSPTAVAAEVNNEKIMLVDLERMVSSYRERVPALAANTPDAQAALQSVREQILESLITQRLLYQEAVRRKIAPNREDIDKAMLQFKSSFEKTEDFQTMLTRAGKTEQDVRQRITEEMAIRELTRQLTADVVVPEADITKFYNDNPKEFTTRELMRAHHILIAFPQKKSADGRVEFLQPSAADKAKLRARANSILKQAQAKDADFQKLALQYSEDPTAKGSELNPGNKGNLGEFAREQVLKSFADKAFAAPVGQVIGPVETEYGFHIIRVDSKTPSRVLPLSEVHDDIKMVLVQEKAKTRLDQSINEIAKRATIKKNI
ncbi:MAG TPA: peptidylprolyl isomerase [Abditibacteriaceae bacterium]|jgi:parvulin-like peptidyl-prolyl isomerase